MPMPPASVKSGGKMFAPIAVPARSRAGDAFEAHSPVRHMPIAALQPAQPKTARRASANRTNAG